jgi:hypothetical protein
VVVVVVVVDWQPPPTHYEKMYRKGELSLYAFPDRRLKDTYSIRGKIFFLVSIMFRQVLRLIPSPVKMVLRAHSMGSRGPRRAAEISIKWCLIIYRDNLRFYLSP